MSRIRILPYGASTSVTLLSNALTTILQRPASRLRREGSTFRGRQGDIIINWGSSRNTDDHQRMIGAAMVLNEPLNVSTASNKIRSLEAMRNSEVKTIEWTLDRETAMSWIQEGGQVMVRTVLNGHSGEGIICVSSERPEHLGNVAWTSELPQANLYTKRITSPFREYRIHVMQGQIIFIQQKRRRSGWEELETYSNVVRNHGNGWVYSHLEMTQPNAACLEEACNAVRALGLTFGAVDVITNRDDAWVLEVNTAPGLQGDTTLSRYVQAFSAIIQGEEVPDFGYSVSEEVEVVEEEPSPLTVNAAADWSTLNWAETLRPVEGVSVEPAAMPLSQHPTYLAFQSVRQYIEENDSIPVGTHVTMSEAGMDYYQESDDNPFGILGVVVETGYSVEVDWSNGHHNTYDSCELSVVSPATISAPNIGDLVILSAFGTMCSMLRHDSTYVVTAINHDHYELRSVVEGIENTTVPFTGVITTYRRAGDHEFSIEEPVEELADDSGFENGSFHIFEANGVRKVGEYCVLNRGFWDTTLSLHLLTEVTVIREVNVNE